MKKLLLKTCCATLLLGSLTVQGAEVWRCKSASGGIVFSDVPCPSTGEPVPARQLQSNIVQAQRLPPTDADREAQPAEGRRENVCPGDLELRNMETQASSTSLSPKASSFLQDEIRRVRQCRKGQGRYTAEDWRISQAARDAQSSTSTQEAARSAAEAMHSAADPIEGDRIAQARAQEQAQAERRRLRPPPPQQFPLPRPPGRAASGPR